MRKASANELTDVDSRIRGLRLPGTFMIFEENRDGWYCALANSRVQMIQIDFRLSLLISDGTAKIWVHIEAPGKLVSVAGAVEFVPEDTPSVAPILGWFDAKVKDIRVLKIGLMRIELEGDRWLEVGPDSSFEAWQIGYSGGREDCMFVCAPGGEVSLFRENGPARLKRV